MVLPPTRLRRATTLVSYWRDSKLIFENYRSGVLISADPIVASLLHSLSKWQTPAQVCRRVPEFTPSSVQSTLRQLTRRGFLVREGSLAARDDAKLQQSWAPYVSDLGESRRALLVHARREPAPPELKQYPRAARLQLPDSNRKGDFPQVLLARRTWREFSKRRLDLEDLSTLLWLTCGVQYWVKLPGSIGRVALKTSPSAGGGIRGGSAQRGKAFGLDGIMESPVYAAGVGTRPPAKEWAPWPEPGVRLSKTRNFPVGKSRMV
jgi:hypothetical protein